MKKAESEFLRKSKAAKKREQRTSSKQNETSKRMKDGKESEEERRSQAKEKERASKRKRNAPKQKCQKRNFEMVTAAAGFLWLHFISKSFFVLAAGQHSQL